MARTKGQGASGPAPAIRCAIYTRKSTSEGLDRDFNSLDAQREACEAYVKSQAGEGWTALPDRYDDGGFTGGNMDRPAFRRLMADVEAGRIGCVVVYKVDRLSRSLLDFARIMEAFEKHGVSFVSITQQFNTATSMGRLMLNVLLSFAQFEREIISERTRDKIAAARKKGKWTGGYPVLGYDIDPKMRRLAVNEEEAARVRAIFGLYLERGSLSGAVEALGERGWTTKEWTAKNGGLKPGQPFDKGRLHRLLTNVAYIGKVRHKDQIYEGEHEAILDEPTWRRTQALLEANGRSGERSARAKSDAPLRGLIRCAACGAAMVHTYSVKKGKRYRYYVCSNAQGRGLGTCRAKSVAAGDLEAFVAERLCGAAKDPAPLAKAFEAARRERKEDEKRLSVHRRRLEKEIAKLGGEAGRLLKILGEGAGGADRLATERLAEIDRRLGARRGRLAAVEEEAVRLDGARVGESDLKAALSAFDSVWDALWPRERARVLGLAIERIDCDAAGGELKIAFSPAGIKSLAAEMRGAAARTERG